MAELETEMEEKSSGTLPQWGSLWHEGWCWIQSGFWWIVWETKKHFPNDQVLGCYKGVLTTTTTNRVCHWLPIVRLTKVFWDNSGMQKPDNPQQDSTGEQQLKTCCLDISHQVLKHCTGWERGHLNTIQAHAIHAEKILTSAAARVSQRKERLIEGLQVAQLEGIHPTQLE